jgi:hypothetical protein
LHTIITFAEQWWRAFALFGAYLVYMRWLRPKLGGG